MAPQTVISQSDIGSGLRRIDIQPGMKLMVHSSLKGFGRHVEGGPTAVIKALMDTIGARGIMMMPSFNHGELSDNGATGCYDPLETPTTDGAIPDAFWRISGVRRSLNPSHPFAVWGSEAEAYTAGHHRTLTMGVNSPLGMLYKEDGFCLFIGTDYRTNTFHHVVETLNGATCLGRRVERYPVKLPDGRVVYGRTWGWRSAPCPLIQTVGYADRMSGLHRQTRIVRSMLTLYRLKDAFNVISKILERGQGGFPACRKCSVSPRRVAQTVPSDWDADAGRPKPDSEAWNY